MAKNANAWRRAAVGLGDQKSGGGGGGNDEEDDDGDRMRVFPFDAAALHALYPASYPKSDFLAPGALAAAVSPGSQVGAAEAAAAAAVPAASFAAPATRRPFEGRLRHITHDNPEYAYLLWWQAERGRSELSSGRSSRSSSSRSSSSRSSGSSGSSRSSGSNGSSTGGGGESGARWTFVWGVEYDVGCSGGWVPFLEDAMAGDATMASADMLGKGAFRGYPRVHGTAQGGRRHRFRRGGSKAAIETVALAAATLFYCLHSMFCCVLATCFLLMVLRDDGRGAAVGDLDARGTHQLRAAAGHARWRRPARRHVRAPLIMAAPRRAAPAPPPVGGCSSAPISHACARACGCAGMLRWCASLPAHLTYSTGATPPAASGEYSGEKAAPKQDTRTTPALHALLHARTSRRFVSSHPVLFGITVVHSLHHNARATCACFSFSCFFSFSPAV